jgi:hypothetical protein
MLARCANFREPFMVKSKHQGAGIFALMKWSKGFGFIKNGKEPCVYKKLSGSFKAFLILYVDDISLIGNDVDFHNTIKE